ncbi:MAG: hypothetical protein ACTHKV_02455 [Flavipsychrobacter sp.]
MRYTAKGEHNRHFELYDDNGDSIGRIDYDGWFSVNVTLQYRGMEYQVAPSNVWHTAILVTQGDREVAEIRQNWAGHLVLHLADGNTYLYKHGFFDTRMTLYNADEQVLVVVQPDFKWSKFSFNYEMEANDNYLEAKDGLLMLILIYCCNNKKRHGAA